MAGAATHAVVSLAALDLRPRPDHRAELASQLLLGEIVRLLPGRAPGDWCRVRAMADGYEGWVRAWGLVPTTAARARRWERAATAAVSVPWVGVTARPGGGLAVGPLFLGSRVIARPARSGAHAVELPDGRRGWVPAGALRRGRTRPPALLERVESLLGAPYLWGGRTPAGLDCSAFVQLVLAEQGVRLPRDAREQCSASARLGPDEPAREGDLAFFAAPGRPVGHVGLALGGGWFAHCRATVRLASLDPDNAMYDNELAPQMIGWYRVAWGRRRSPGLSGG